MEEELLHRRQIILEREFIAEEQAQALKEIYDTYREFSTNKDYSGNPVVHFYDVLRRSPAGASVMHMVARRVLATVAGAFPMIRPLYVESVFVAAMGPGGLHLRHADNCRPIGEGRWEPNHTPQRDMSALVYLNGDFDGGEIYFPVRDVVVKPEACLLIGFPSGETHEHEVLPVQAGYRYSFPVWMTKRKQNALPEFAGIL